MLPYETGATRVSLAYQAHLEKMHAQRADLVITPSRYCAERLDEFYHVRNALVIPELIDLGSWRDLLREQPRVYFVETALHRAVRVQVLFPEAHSCAAAHRGFPPTASSRIGSAHRRRRTRGPSACGSWWRELHLEDTVRWLGDVTAGQLAAEYNGADVFCLPSVQEGFGIVFLEAMAAGKPIVATHAAAVPEVVVTAAMEPEDGDALADALEKLYGDSQLRTSLADQGRRDVETFDMRRVARRFMETVSEEKEKEIAQ